MKYIIYMEEQLSRNNQLCSKKPRKVIAASFRPQKTGIGFSVNAGRRSGRVSEDVVADRVARRRSGSDILYCQIPTRQIHNCVNAGTARVLAATTARRAMASCGCKRDRERAVGKGKGCGRENGRGRRKREVPPGTGSLIFQGLRQKEVSPLCKVLLFQPIIIN